MPTGLFHFNPEQRSLIQKMDVADMIEIFSLDYRNVADFLGALHKQPRPLVIDTGVFQLSFTTAHLELGIKNGLLGFRLEQQWQRADKQYRLLGVYLAEHLNKDPFQFLDKPEKQKPKITIEDLFFTMSLSQIGSTSLSDILAAEVLPARKKRALQRTVERLNKKRSYSVSEIFTKLPLSQVGNLTLSQFFGASVFTSQKKKP